jgi:hypothetical protein
MYTLLRWLAGIWRAPADTCESRAASCCAVHSGICKTPLLAVATSNLVEAVRLSERTLFSGTLFLGRLAFIFGGSLFGVVFFRHLPEINHGADLWLMFRRGLQLLASLFALFCVTLELERLGRTVGGSQ